MTVVDDIGVRTRTIVVGVVDDRWAGSLAYALKLSLAEAARIRVVRVSSTEPSLRRMLSLPLRVVEASGDPAQVLLHEGANADLLVIEGHFDDVASLGDPVMTALRRQAGTLMIEVDSDGEILRASGAAGPVVIVPEGLTTGR